MAGTASYRVTTADYEHMHAYITDRRYLESQTNEESEWGPVREKFSRNLLAAMTPMGEDLTNEGINYLSHLLGQRGVKKYGRGKGDMPISLHQLYPPSHAAEE